MSGARIDAVDRRVILATQEGLPLEPLPYRAVAEALGLEERDVITRIERMKAAGVVRRVAAVPNHYAVGYRANAMTVWDVPDEKVDAVGERVGALDFVSHCYRRPRRLPVWRYNLFAMVHGRDRAEAEARIAKLREVIDADADAHDVLWSKRILKKTGLRLRDQVGERG